VQWRKDEKLLAVCRATQKGIKKHALEQNADEAAVGEQIQRLKQLEIISLFGKIDFHPNYDYKFERRRKRTGN